ncbi:MAG TPA: hypothetical protein PLF13_08680 [candidate division Zixibacteria bacterium]|nr:hypothetical protein [candidate division Zixibacteria bacterium]
MKKIWFSTIALALIADSAHAANLAVITTPPALLNSVVLIGAVVCGVGAYKVLSTVRGGLLSRSWRMFLVGFAVLVLSQAAWLIDVLEIYALPTYVGPALLTIAIGFLTYGIFETKKALG